MVESPTNYNKRLPNGTLALKKRSSYPAFSPRKLSFKLCVEPLRVESRCASNSYRCLNLNDLTTTILPGDLLVKVSGLTEDELIQLSHEMQRRYVESCTAPDSAVTRSRTRTAQISMFSATRAKQQRTNIVYSLKRFFSRRY